MSKLPGKSPPPVEPASGICILNITNNMNLLFGVDCS